MAKRFVKAWLLAAYVTAEHNELLLARAATIDVFFKNATAPNTWTVRSREDIDGPHTDIYNKSKHVYRAHVQGKRVVVKSGGWSGSSSENSVLYFEMVYMEALRGEPGIPDLLGAWFEEDRNLTYVVRDCGETIGKGIIGKGSSMSLAYARRAADAPLQLARSLLMCFRSWASAGFLLDDFRVSQFTLNGAGEIYLVDGPKALANAPLGIFAAACTSGQPGRGVLLVNNTARACERDSDCPRSGYKHSCHQRQVCGKHGCHKHRACEVGARGAPEALGKCRADGACLLLSEKTHVYDVANRPWLLPYIAERARGAANDLLLAVIRRASAKNPDDRPSFAELVNFIGNGTATAVLRQWRRRGDLVRTRAGWRWPPRRPRSNGTVTAAATNPINSFVDSLCVRHGVNYQKDVGSPTIDGGSANWKTMRLAKKDGRYCAAHKMGRNVLYALGMTKTLQPLNPEGHGLVNTFKRWAAFAKKCRLFDNSQKDFHVKLSPLLDQHVLQEPRDGDEMGDVG